MQRGSKTQRIQSRYALLRSGGFEVICGAVEKLEARVEHAEVRSGWLAVRLLPSLPHIPGANGQHSLSTLHPGNRHATAIQFIKQHLTL